MIFVRANGSPADVARVRLWTARAEGFDADADADADAGGDADASSTAWLETALGATATPPDAVPQWLAMGALAGSGRNDSQRLPSRGWTAHSSSAPRPDTPRRAWVRPGRVLTASGVTAAVAVERGALAGSAQLLSDGEVRTYLAVVLVAPGRRGSGTGRAPVGAAAHFVGAIRVDVLASTESAGVYERFTHKVVPG